MNTTVLALAVSAALPVLCLPLRAGETAQASALGSPPEVDPGVNLLTGEGVSLGGVFFPHFHAAGAFGGSTADEVSSLASGHHDPQADATLQALEPGLSMRLGDHVEGFGTYSAATDADGDIDGDLEELFLKLKGLPGGFELRGGQFLNRFGFQNATHSHGWDFVNQNLANGRLLQEGEVTSIGGEATWNLPTPFRSALSASLGGTPSHGEDEHAHGEAEEADFEGEAARFDSYVAGLHYQAQLDDNDFHQNRLTTSAAWGENAFGRTTQIYGIGYEYLWRENGYEAGGRYLRWRNEAVYRHVAAVSGELHAEEDDEHAEEEGHHGEEEDHHDEAPARRGDFDEFGFYSMVVYGFNEHVETALRAGYVSGISEMGLDERWRVSPNLTLSLNAQRTLFLRLQYDFDHSSDFGDEHSAWAQIGFNWGGAEVR